MGRKVGAGKKCGARSLAAILSAGMLMSQMSIGAMATDPGDIIILEETENDAEDTDVSVTESEEGNEESQDESDAQSAAEVSAEPVTEATSEDQEDAKELVIDITDEATEKSSEISLEDEDGSTEEDVLKDAPSDIFDGELSENGGTISNEYFKVTVGKHGQISTLKLVGDEFDTNYVMNESNTPSQNTSGHEWLGELMLATRSDDSSDYRDERTANSADIRRIYVDQDKKKITVVYDPSLDESVSSKEISDLLIVETYTLTEDKLKWEISLKNVTGGDITVGDLGLPLPFNEFWTRGDQIYETRSVDHSFVGQNGSYIYVTRPSGQGRFLLMTPDQSTDAGFEYQDHWRTNERESYEQAWCQDQSGWQNGLNVFYIHSDNIKKTNRGYLPNTSLKLLSGEEKTYAFDFSAVPNMESLGSALYNEGIIDAVAVPGMTFARNMPAKMYLHTTIDPEDISIDIQCPDELGLFDGHGNTVSSSLPHQGDATMTYEKTVEKDGEQYHVYDLKFYDLGHHNVTLSWNDKKTTFQFYIMDDIDGALETHSTFMVDKTQLDLPGQTGDKVFDDWMMDQKTTRNNVERDYFNMSYWGWGDDWGLTHGTFLAEKNVYQPKASEVAALDEYLDKAIWNGLMQEHHNDYLVHDFLMNEPNSSPTYRGYAYPHIYNTYFMMYKIASKYPDLVDYKETPDTYLLRAYNILNALYNGKGVAYNWGTGVMGESTTPAIIDALRAEGFEDKARSVEALMDEKYNSFKRQQYPYGSEYSYDNTGEEAVYVLAKMQLEAGKDTSNAERMMSAIDLKTRACRGTQPVWYEYSVPVTNCGENWWQFQYSMSLVGYCMDDYIRYQNNGLTQEEKAKAQRLSYAAKLGNLTCINSGQIDADPENIGAAAWTYQAEMGNLGGQGTGGGKLHNGWRQMTGEADLGLFGAVQILSSDVAEDPIFGLFGYGCEVYEDNGYYVVTPLDGLYTKLNLINEELYLELERDQYTAAKISNQKNNLEFTIKNLEKTQHTSEVTLYGLKEGAYTLLVDGEAQCGFNVLSSDSEVTVPVNLSGDELSDVTITEGAFDGSIVVDAGEDITVDLYDEVKLNGKISDSSDAANKLSGIWTVTREPENGKATIATPENLSTYVTFSGAGVYEFTLTANSLESDSVIVTVTDDNKLPELVAEYTFDNINGNKIINEVEGGKNAETVGSFTTATGKDGTQGFSISGSNSNGYVRLDESLFKRLKESTVSADIKLNASNGNGARVFSFDDNAGKEVYVSFENGNELVLSVNKEKYNSGVAIAKDFFKNVALTLDGQNAVLYVDGYEKINVPCSLSLSSLKANQSDYLGRGTNQTDPYFNGIIDNFRVYSVAFDSDKALELFGTGEEVVITSAIAADVVTPVGKMPKLPAMVQVLYSNGIYEKAEVVWDEIDPDSYSKAGVFTVNGVVKGYDITASVTVMVVNGSLVNLAENAVPSAIYENRNDLGGCPTLNDGYEPSSSRDTSHGTWHNWGGNNGAQAWVQYTWEQEQILTGSDAYYFRDGNGNFNPASVSYMYLDSDKTTWKSFTGVEGLGVELNKFNKTTFDPVKTTAIRMILNPQNLGSGVIEWRVYGYGDALSAAKQSLKDDIKAFKLVKKTHVTQGFETLTEAIAAAEEMLNKEDASDEDLKAADEAMAKAFAELKIEDDNLSFVAQLSASYTSSWESLPAVNDGNLPVDSYNSRYGHWGTWGNTSSSESLTYLWPVEVTFNTSNMYLWYDGSEIDNGGINYPSQITYEILDEEGNFTKISTVDADGLVVDDFTVSEFDTITTKGIRVTFKKIENGYTGVGVHEWQIKNIVKEEPVKATLISKYGSYYLVTEDGTKLTGLQKVDGNYRYFKETTGVMVVGKYVTIGDDTYYFDKDGIMVTGFMTSWGSTYYFDENGIQYKDGIFEIEGNKYYFNSKGAMVALDYVTLGENTYFFDKEGHMVTGFMTRWGNTYYFDENGARVIDGVREADGEKYYFNHKGLMVTSSFVDLEDGRHYFDSEGHMVIGRTITKWFTQYTFDENGVLIN
jgi:glucan-binding repeat-containing protein